MANSGTQDAVDGLVLESAATKQAEWMQMEMRERPSQQDIKRRIARMIARWNDVYLVS